MSMARTCRSSAAMRRASHDGSPALAARAGRPLSVDVIAGVGRQPRRPRGASSATTTIPIVFMQAATRSQRVWSRQLARPGGNTHRVQPTCRPSSMPSGWSCCTRWCPRVSVISPAREPEQSGSPSADARRCRKRRARRRGELLDPSTAAHPEELDRRLRIARAASSRRRSSSLTTRCLISRSRAARLRAGATPCRSGDLRWREIAAAGGLSATDRASQNARHRQAGIMSPRS